MIPAVNELKCIKFQLQQAGKEQGDRGEQECVCQRLGCETNTNSSQGAHAYRDRASVTTMPFVLPLKRAETSGSFPEQTGEEEKEIIHQGKDRSRWSAWRRGEVNRDYDCFAKLQWPCLCISPALIAGSYLLHLHLKLTSVPSLSWGFLSGYLDRHRTHIASLGMYPLCKDAKMYYAILRLIYLSKNITARFSIFMVHGKRQEL